MISDRKLAANRRNARLSTGPRTQAGLARSSRNAVRHGLDARSPVIPALDEDPAAWDAHLASTLLGLAPVSPSPRWGKGSGDGWPTLTNTPP